MVFFCAQLRLAFFLICYNATMAIVWNKVTWYSKLLAAIFFIFIVPAITFYVGKAYEFTQAQINALKVVNTTTEPDSVEAIPPDQLALESGSPASVTSGIYGEAFIGNSPYNGHLAVKDISGKVITITKVRDDGKFLLVLRPGSYELEAMSSTPMPAFKPTDFAVQKDTLSKVTLQFKENLQ